MTPKQNKFAAEYLVDQNGVEAARRAGYTGSDKTLAAMASENLTKPEIRAAIDESLRRRNERVEVKADDVLRELCRIAFSDIGQAFDEKGQLRPLHEMPLDVRRAIAAVETVTVGDQDGAPVVLRKVKFWNKNQGVDTLMKHLGLLIERKQVDVRLTLEQLVLEAMGDAAPARQTVAGSVVAEKAGRLPEAGSHVDDVPGESDAGASGSDAGEPARNRRGPA
jgi:phage terminase small subunit